MTKNQQLEQLSRVYVRAVAAASGFTVVTPEIDDDSVDLGIMSGPLPRRPRIEMQLKSTQRDLPDQGFSFPLKLKNYEDLRLDTLVPRILVVVVFPPGRLPDLLLVSREELLLRGSAYWSSLKGMPETDNRASVNIAVPPHLFDPSALRTIMKRVSE